MSYDTQSVTAFLEIQDSKLFQPPGVKHKESSALGNTFLEEALQFVLRTLQVEFRE